MRGWTHRGSHSGSRLLSVVVDMTRGNQRDLARAKNAKKAAEKGRKEDGLTPQQRRERYVVLTSTCGVEGGGEGEGRARECACETDRPTDQPRVRHTKSEEYKRVRGCWEGAKSVGVRVSSCTRDGGTHSRLSPCVRVVCLCLCFVSAASACGWRAGCVSICARARGRISLT